MFDHVYYINLDHRTDRNEQIKDELTYMGFPPEKYERFPAVYFPSIGGVGCGKSHIAVLQDAIQKNYANILVLEDDFEFCVSTEIFYQQLENLTNMDYDVCLLSYHLLQSEELGTPHFLKVLDAQTTSGYIIQRHYYQKLMDVFCEATDHFEKTNHHWLYAIDIAWKQLQSTDKWICFNPRIGKQRPSYSDCSNTMNQEDW